MPARRRSAKTVSTPVKSSSAKSPVIMKEVVTKYSQPRQIKTVTETPTKTRRFAPTRPEEPKITLEEYISDFKVRMQINNYEVMEFLEDCKKWYNSASPYVVKAFNYSKEKIQELQASTTQEEKKEDKPAE